MLQYMSRYIHNFEHMTNSDPESSAGRSPRDRAAPLLSKHGMAVTELAGVLLGLAAGDRLEPVQEQATRLAASVGTIQAALEYIQSLGAAQIEARGRLGSFVVRLDYPLLWDLALHRAILGALPLPYSRRFEGLATGLRQQFASAALELNLRFLRGSKRRLEAVATRECDWTLASAFAADSAAARGLAVQVAARLGPQTYMAGHTLLTRGQAPLAPGDDGLRDGMRVGADPQSDDHLYLVSSLARGHTVELVEIEYSQGLRLLHSGAIDATVWSDEDLPATLGALRAASIDLQREPALAALSEAALVVVSGDRAITHLLGAVLKRKALLAIQAEVVAGKRLPAY
jgi:hypothetical protein